MRADVCIVGAGAAGITLARELAGGSHSVVVLESGGFEFAEEEANLYEGAVSGLPYHLTGSRLRFFGGSTNHWAGQSRPLDEADFEKRSWVRNSGWPFGRDELMAHYRRAQGICDLGPFRYDAKWWFDRMPGVDSLIETDDVGTAIFQIGPATKFGAKFRKVLVDAENVNLVLHANVVNVRTQGRRVTGVDVKTLEGNEFGVDAEVVVLALGGIDNARILLASRDRSPAGVGNQNDLVGRYFMDHSLISVGRLVLSDAAPVPDLYYFVGLPMRRADVQDLKNQPPRYLLAQLVLSRRAARTAEVPSFAATLAGLAPGDDTSGITGADVTALVGDVEGRTGVTRPVLEMTTILGDVYRSTDRFELQVNMEPTPNPDSRVTLTADLDPLGMPRIDLHWVFDSDDYDSIARGAEVLAREIGRTGMGRLHIRPAPGLNAKYGNHHMGTTRMHDNPKRGVVDRHGEVHGVRNLYMAGSSVFPGGGFSNPTMTIVALALRLAERIDRVLDS